MTMEFESPEQIEGALERLGARLDYEGTAPISLVVCGGSALSIRQIAERTTKDVDVLALVEETAGGPQIRRLQRLPESFRHLVAEVGYDLRLEEDWLNMAPRDVVSTYGVPDGLMERCEKREYGASLTVYFVSRFDQVHLKLLAAIDPEADPQHVEDLTERIKPTTEEMEAAVKWISGRNESPNVRRRLRNAVETLGYDNISRNIPD